MYNLRLRASQRSALLSLAGSVAGYGSASVPFQATASGIIGFSGSASAVAIPIGLAVGEQKPTGEGYYRFSCEVATAVGYMGVFGAGAAQVKFNKSAVGMFVPVGVGAAQIISAYGIGASGSVLGNGLVTVPFPVAAYGGTPPFSGWAYGTGAASVSLKGSSVGISAVVGNANAAVKMRGIGLGILGQFGTAKAGLNLSAIGVGGRGAFSAGAASVRFTGKATGASGSSAVGRANQFINVSAAGSVTAMVLCAGVGEIRLRCAGYGERWVEYPDAGKDLVFVKTDTPRIFVRTEL